MIETQIAEEKEESTPAPVATLSPQELTSPAQNSEFGDQLNTIPGMMRNESPSPVMSSEHVLDYKKQGEEKINNIGERLSSDGGAETLKYSLKDEDEALTNELEVAHVIDRVFKQQKDKRDAESKTMHEQIEEAKELVSKGDAMVKPESLIDYDFGLESLLAEREDRDTQANSSNYGRLSARKLMKEEMRNLDNQQRQAYIRQTLKSQQDGYRSRKSFEQTRGNSALNGFFRQSQQRQSLETSCKKTLQLRQRLQPKTRTNAKSIGLDPSRGLFKKSANATHHFFNQRVRASTSMTMGQFETDMATKDDYRRTQNLNFNQSRPSIDLQNYSRQEHALKRKSNMTAMARRSTKMESFETSSFKGSTYPNVPMVTKIAEKGRKNQLQNVASSSNAWQIAQPATFHSNQSSQMTHFVEEPRGDVIFHERRRGRPSRIPRKNMTQEHSIENNTPPQDTPNLSLPLNRFNASHEVTVKAVPIYDSIRQAHVNFPKEVDPQLSIMSSNLQESLPLKAPKETTQASRETLIVRQIEKDLLKLKEDLMQAEMDRNDQKTVLNAAEQQNQMKSDFDMACNNLRKLAGCFWRFTDVNKMVEDVIKTFEAIIEKHKRSLTLFIGQVRGQFELISDAVLEQKAHQDKIEDHLRREHEFKQKVLNRENKEVLELIKDFEFMPQISQSKKAPNLGMSNIMKELAYISHQLENAQLNVETLSLYGEREVPENPGIISDVKQEKMQRTRTIQVNTAKRVLHRFYTRKIRVDQEIQTDTDEIAMLKNHYESTIDAMLERDVELNQKVEQLTHKSTIQQNRVEMLEKVKSDLKDNIEGLELKIDTLNNLQKALLNQIKEGDRERRSQDKTLQETNLRLRNSDKMNQNRIMEISKLKDQNKKLEKEVLNLEIGKKETEESVDPTEETAQTIPDQRNAAQDEEKIKELESQVKVKTEEVGKLKIELKKTSAKLSRLQTSDARSRKDSQDLNVADKKVQPASLKTTSTALKNPSSHKQLPSREPSETRIPSHKERPSRNDLGGLMKSKDSVCSFTTQVMKDGRCPKCSTKLKQDIQIPGEEIVVRFQNMVLGRQSNVFKNVMNQVKRRVVNYESQHTEMIRETEDDERFKRDDESNMSFRPRSVMQAKKNYGNKSNDSSQFSASPSPMKSIKTKKLSMGEIPKKATREQNVQTSRGLNSRVSPKNEVQKRKHESQTRGAKTMKLNAKKKLVDLTQEMSQAMNYRFALDDKEIENRTRLVKQKLNTGRSSEDPGTMVPQSRGEDTPNSYDTMHRQISDHKRVGKMFAADHYGLVSGSNTIGKQSSEQGNALRPRFHVSEKQTQTEYEAEDVQALFLRKIDEIVGGKLYRSVSPHGQPRLTAEQDATQVERITAHRSSFFVATNYSTSQVHNVPNVARMRKFEPLRRKTQEMRHAQTLPEPNELLVDDDEDNYTFYRGPNHLGKEEPMQILDASRQSMTVTDFEEKKEQRLASDYVSELGNGENGKSTGLNSDAMREKKLGIASESTL